MNNKNDFHIFKKSLGQNFLKNKSAIQDLLKLLDLQKNDLVIEIGPGQGALTDELVKVVNNLVLIEKDSNLINYLSSKYPQVNIINQDFLKINLNWITQREKYKVIGSLPYNVSKKIIYNLLTATNKPDKISFIIQKEVAQEYVSKPPKATLLSNFANIYSDVKLDKVISAKSFYPVPKVDGQIIAFKNIKPKVSNHEILWSLIRTGFSSPRKIVASNLKNYEKNNVLEALSTLNLSPTIRAGELTLENWIDLQKKLNL